MLKKILALVAMLYAAACFAAVDVNKANAAELDSIKGIGPAISTKIIDERKKGDFKDWNDFITRVKGVGEGNAAKFSTEGLTVGGATYKGAVAAPAAKKDEKPAAKAEEKKADTKPATTAATPAVTPAAAAPVAKEEKKDAKAEAKAKTEAEKKAKAEEKQKKSDDAKAKKEAAKMAKDTKPAVKEEKKDAKAEAAKPAASAAKK